MQRLFSKPGAKTGCCLLIAVFILFVSAVPSAVAADPLLLSAAGAGAAGAGSSGAGAAGAGAAGAGGAAIEQQGSGAGAAAAGSAGKGAATGLSPLAITGLAILGGGILALVASSSSGSSTSNH